jgi:hypothetical protein
MPVEKMAEIHERLIISPATRTEEPNRSTKARSATRRHK